MPDPFCVSASVVPPPASVSAPVSVVAKVEVESTKPVPATLFLMSLFRTPPETFTNCSVLPPSTTIVFVEMFCPAVAPAVSVPMMIVLALVMRVPPW